MPTSSDRQRELMTQWFGDVDTDGPMRFLKARGWVCNAAWCWEKPTPSYRYSVYEEECIHFLMDEWDFGGIV